MPRRIRSSRLSRYAEKQNRRQFILFGLGTVTIIILLFAFAGTLLNLFGTVIFGIKGEDNEVNKESVYDQVLFAPNLTSIPNATSSAQIDIIGESTYDKGDAVLFVNGSQEMEASLKKDGTFKFRAVNLKSGENKIQVKYSSGIKESELSAIYTITRSSKEPQLEITSPQNDASFSRADKKINVNGKTDPNNIVTINGFRAVVSSSGEFTYLLELSDGDNNIKIEAINEASVTATKELKVNYKSD